MPETFRIRRATTVDIPAILRLERASDTAAHWGEDDYRRIFDPSALARMALVSERDNITGFLVARTAGTEWEIENVAVDPVERRRGTGRALVGELLRLAGESAAEFVMLEVRASNQAARALYQGCGFSDCGLRRAYYADPEEDAVQYRIQLAAGASESR